MVVNNRTDTVTSNGTIKKRTHRNEYLGIPKDLNYIFEYIEQKSLQIKHAILGS